MLPPGPRSTQQRGWVLDARHLLPLFMMRHRVRNDMIDPSDAAEQTENAEAKDPIEPSESAEPTDPIDSTEPLDAIERNES